MQMIVLYLFAAACALLVVSLPIAGTSIGSMLRRYAGVLFLLAITPALFFGLIGSQSVVGSPSVDGTGTSPGVSANSFGCVIGFVLLSLLSYAVLEIRRRFRRPKKDAWSEYINARSAGKTIVRDRDKRPGIPPLAPTDTDEDGT
ncbi:MAG: hypothetical protein QOI24_1273 [Acidobacteriota bacterium]|jgi:membrane associated rhomboid family serine protease|nr:hypothetical protein [Acidobacteriota bacterium]